MRVKQFSDWSAGLWGAVEGAEFFTQESVLATAIGWLSTAQRMPADTVRVIRGCWYGNVVTLGRRCCFALTCRNAAATYFVVWARGSRRAGHARRERPHGRCESQCGQAACAGEHARGWQQRGPRSIPGHVCCKQQQGEHWPYTQPTTAAVAELNPCQPHSTWLCW